MHAVAAFFASIITFVSGLFGSSLLASNSPINVPTTQPAAAAAAQTEIAGNPFNAHRRGVSGHGGSRRRFRTHCTAYGTADSH